MAMIILFAFVVYILMIIFGSPEDRSDALHEIGNFFIVIGVGLIVVIGLAALLFH